MTDKKRKADIDRAKPTTARPSSWYARRPALLLWTFAGLLLAFYLLGGVTYVSNRYAESAVAARDFDTARKWLAFSLKSAPQEPTAHFLLARIARHEGDVPSMAEHLKAAGNSGFSVDRLRLEEMLSLAQSGHLGQVEKELSSRLAQGDSDAPEICDAYANGLAKESRFDDAIAILKAWRSDRPDDAVPYYRMARIQEHLQQLDEAKVNYKTSVQKNPKYYPAVYSVARIYLDENDATEAAKYFEKCLSMPNPLAAKTGLALSLVKLGEVQRAATLLEEVQACDWSLVQASYASVNESSERNVAACELGKLYQTEGKLEEALKMLDIALKDNSRDLAARYTRALVLKAMHRDDEANADFELVAKSKSAMERVNVLRNKINRESDDIAARLELGKLLIEYESERNGLFWVRSALQISSDNIEVHRTLAEYYESHAQQSPDYEQLAKHHRAEIVRLESKK